MYISSLTLNNFRNYENEKIEFSPLTNMIYGKNAQGKTNILEAVYLVSQGRSHRAKSDKDMIRFGSDFAGITMEFHDKNRDYKAVMRLLKNGRKSIMINNVKITKLSMLMRYLNTVMFSPEDLELVKGAPSVRRHFLDSALSQLYPNYLVNLIDYNKILLNKNCLLKTLRHNPSDRAMLDLWNSQLAVHGAKIMEYRTEAVKILGRFAARIQKEISNEILVTEYSPSIKADELTPRAFEEFLNARAEREIENSSALYGIQRDDISITIDGHEARVFSSQGQQRTASLSLKIAQADYMESIREEYPVLLLDDILSELDISRRTYLAEKIKNKQVLITSTDTDLKSDTADTKLFCVSGGRIVR